MAQWFLEVRGESMGLGNLEQIYNRLACLPEDEKPQAQLGNTWLVPVTGPEDLDTVTPLPNGVVGIQSR